MEWEFRPAFAAVIPGNKRVDLEWTRAAVRGTAPAGFFTGYRVKDSKGTVVCETTALKCSVRNLVNASKVSFSVEATTIADSSPVGQSKTVIVGGLRQVANAMRRGRSALLTGIATTNSRGKVTWRAVSGGCRISGRILTTPASGSTCRLRVSVAKAGAFPAQSLNVTVRLLA